MADLSFLHKTITSIAAVDADYEARYQQRRHLGLSQIGHECDRWLWFKNQGLDEIHPPEGRILRLFQLGNLIEDQMAIDLQSCGFRLHSQQKKVIFTQGDLQLQGSCDGVIEYLLESEKPHLWECKSMSGKNFAKVKKDGYEAYNSKYKAQCHVYALGLKLSRIYATCYNKDTSELYAERIKLDREFAVGRLQRAFDVMREPVAPDRKFCPRADWYQAKFCEFRGVCFK